MAGSGGRHHPAAVAARRDGRLAAAGARIPGLLTDTVRRVGRRGERDRWTACDAVPVPITDLSSPEITADHPGGTPGIREAGGGSSARG
ncbi:hypothetical protein C1701_07255 [Actinoalloteichus sp. AHMU CJ021]|nr:hypothetical protein C1701_07255 [Actinoalloteichus sp. AHMU CJ021]